MGAPVWLDVAGLAPARAVAAIEEALRGGLDPEADPARTPVAVPAGELLLMPAVGRDFAGVKVVSIAPDNPSRGLPRIQGTYLLFDGRTLAPVALADGAALTAVRTPAVSAVAVRALTADRPLRTVLFGTGPQAWGHARVLAEVRRIEQLTVVGRDGGRTRDFVRTARAAGLPAHAGDAAAVRDADLVVCCTTAREPVFDGALAGPDCCVVAVGSHRPDVREVDRTLVDRSIVYVEARAAATREAGEVVGVDPARLTNLAELLAAPHPVDPGRPRLFKSVGMAWEDLVTAAAAFAAIP